jgi:hypothetical protein
MGEESSPFQPGDLVRATETCRPGIVAGTVYRVVEASESGLLSFADDDGDLRYRCIQNYALVERAALTPPEPEAPALPEVRLWASWA